MKTISENTIAGVIIGAAITVHKALGPGLLESAYKERLFYELSQSGLQVEKEKSFPLVYKSVRLECGYRADLFIENRFVVEIKSVECLNDVHLAQTLTYLKLSKSKLCLLINFNVLLLKGGIKRIINGTLDNTE